LFRLEKNAAGTLWQASKARALPRGGAPRATSRPRKPLNITRAGKAGRHMEYDSPFFPLTHLLTY